MSAQLGSGGALLHGQRVCTRGTCKVLPVWDDVFLTWSHDYIHVTYVAHQVFAHRHKRKATPLDAVVQSERSVPFQPISGNSQSWPGKNYERCLIPRKEAAGIIIIGFVVVIIAGSALCVSRGAILVLSHRASGQFALNGRSLPSSPVGGFC
ncbi:hypothetical protein PVAR5_7948 [Paecilomyces variotii No. 5]|uniref:Uncharacterized protein n=1 Tax=Byssochlamys spectabilis (strain No. 5 / NBRC 109023) TaxID=1356009 RepID=V5G479_BYSSN|nr:hypothetical protein PVAR5_7948 [Paecilomyces variotii No. 5]